MLSYIILSCNEFLMNLSLLGYFFFVSDGFLELVFVLMLVLPLIGILILFFIKEYNLLLIKQLTLLITVLVFFLSVLLVILIDFENNYNFQLIFDLKWFEILNLKYSLGLDGLSILFILLTTFLIPLCILASWYSINYRIKLYLIAFLFTEFFLLNIFCALDLFLFYIFFESILIPMFLIIGVWGSRFRRIHASYQFFLYTLFGSLIMLSALIFIYFHVGSTDLKVIYNSSFSNYRQLFLWFAFFLSFAVKIPMMPVHIWLPEAHVEAPTAGSVLLAGVLLKLGTYGFLRFSIPLFIYGTEFFLPLLYTFSLLAVVYSSLTTIRQIDLKKIIAYSSVVHMNFALLGLFTLNIQSLSGSIFLMLSHGIVSGGLFLCVGVIYDRYHTRILYYYNGLNYFMPIFSMFFLIFTFANIGMPGTSSFIGEFLIIIGIFQYNTVVAFLASLSLIFGAAYAVWLYNRIFFGSIQTNYITNFMDLSKREFVILFPLILIILIGGIYPDVFFKLYNLSIYNYFQNYISFVY